MLFRAQLMTHTFKVHVYICDIAMSQSLLTYHRGQLRAKGLIYPLIFQIQQFIEGNCIS